MRIVYMGTPDFAVPALRALIEAGHQIICVYTQPPRPAGRGQREQISPVHEEAVRRGIPVRTPVSLRSEGAQKDFAALKPDVAVVAAYGLILPKGILAAPPYGCINIHASLLPRWRGAAPIQRAILAGDSESGITIMQMDEGLDTGAVLCMQRVPIGPECTAAELHDQLAASGAEQILVALDGVAAGTLSPVPQPAEGVTYAAKLAKSESRIDWTRAARDIDRQVRAFNPWPAAETTLDGEAVKLLRSRCVDDGSAPADENVSFAPGTWLGFHGDALHVSCGDGVLQVLELQRAGRKALPARDFVNAMQPADRAGKVFQ